MNSIASFLAEHHLLRRMTALLEQEKNRLESNITLGPEFAFVEPRFLAAAVDFFQGFGAACHQHHEEQLLWPALAGKPLTPEQSRLLATLAADHRRAQEAVGNLKVATARLLQGHDDALAAILAALDLLIRLYPRHLALEEEALFPLVELYLSPAEQEALAAQVQACAQHHEAARFADVVAAWEARGCKCHL